MYVTIYFHSKVLSLSLKNPLSRVNFFSECMIRKSGTTLKFVLLPKGLVKENTTVEFASTVATDILYDFSQA